MGLLSFVAIDLETTGLDPAQDRVMEIGLIRFDAGQETACLSQLINPLAEVPLRIQNLTGIIPAMLAQKATFPEVAAQIRELIGDLPIVAHNAAFDMAFLRAELNRCGVSLSNRHYDTAELARVALPRAKNHRLNTLVQLMQVQVTRHHRAEDDARACGQVFLGLLAQISQMEMGLIRFILGVGEPANWTLAPLFRAELARREARGEQVRPVTQWIRPYVGQLHSQEQEGSADTPCPVEPELVQELLGPGGVVSDAFPSYEHRPQQLQMAALVSQTFNEGRHLLVEAGTGTGKSLAYLVPAVAWTRRNGEKVAISTHTINLQEQLWEKDIPFLQAALQGTELEGFSAALVKGRPNYICLRKWEEEATGADFLTSPEERAFQIRMAAWLAETETGDKSELNLHGDEERQWLTVMSETETCLGPRCKWYRNHCFAYRARRRARDADLLVINHALLMADINTGGEILPAFRHLIIDEAHHLEDVATQNLGIRLENWDVLGALLHLFRSAGQGFLPVLRRRLPSGIRISARPPVGLPSEDLVERLLDLTASCRAASDELFRLCAQLVEFSGSGEEEGGRSLRLVPSLRGGLLWDAIETARSNCTGRLKQLSQGLLQLAEEIEGLTPRLKDAEGLLVDIQKQSGILNQSARAIDGVLIDPGPADVTWIEINANRDSPRVTLRAAPVNVGAVLDKKLFARVRSVVMTSATLSVGNSFEHLKCRLGLDRIPPDRLATGLVTSPFLYAEQALLCVPEDLPNPKSVTDREFTRSIGDFLRQYLVRTGGRTLVLFTSHRQLRQIYSELKPELEAEGLFLLGQGIDGARGRLVEEFRTADKAVLFGSSSFWEGVDIPGDGLTSVIMVRLPFMPPGDPVMEARIEDLERRGLSSFAHLSLPLAVIRFKQGFGRLIRTRTDRGVVLVLDSRISPRQTRYGSQFIRSLPGPLTVRGSTEHIIETALRFLREPGDIS